MSANLQKYTKAVYLLDAVARRVPADAWDNPSCCEGWTAREAAGHAAWGMKNLANLASGGTGIAEQAEAEVLGDNPAEAMRAVVGEVLAALDQQGVLATEAKTPFGEMTFDSFIGIVWVDPMTHTWDVADAAGIEHGIDEETATAALTQLKPAADALRGPGMFGQAVEPAAGDAVSTFMAFVGRSSVQG